MPSTIPGLVMIVMAVTPGFVFLEWHESRHPARNFGPLRETGAVIGASVLCNLVAALLFAPLHIFWPSGTPDVGRLFREGGDYFQAAYVLIGIWSVVWLGTACAAAVGLALSWEPIGERIGPKLTGRVGRPIRHHSGWAEAFHARPDASVRLGIELTDGTYIYGRLLSFSPQVEEGADRSIVLAGPIDLCRLGGEVTCLQADTLVVGADQIRYLQVFNVPIDKGTTTAAVKS